MHQRPPLHAGAALAGAPAALALLHGRGASAESILELGRELAGEQLPLLAPQATGNSWYPYSFLSPLEQNQPWLDGALDAVDRLVEQVAEAGIGRDRLILAGFSQGACLVAEYAARHARRYGALLLFSGGLIGPPGTSRDYPGSLDGTPVFIGCSDIDPHIPLDRVHETTATLRALGADVTEQIYPGMGHTISIDELDRARSLVATVG